MICSDILELSGEDLEGQRRQFVLKPLHLSGLEIFLDSIDLKARPFGCYYCDNLIIMKLEIVYVDFRVAVLMVEDLEYTIREANAFFLDHLTNGCCCPGILDPISHSLFPFDFLELSIFSNGESCLPAYLEFKPVWMA